MNVSQYVFNNVRAVCPIDGVGIGNASDKTTWRIDFADAATSDQIAAAKDVVTAIDIAGLPGRLAMVEPARAALAASDIVVLRCAEAGVSVSSDWLTYRTALRSIVGLESGAPSTLPAKPSSYPAGS